MRRTESARVLRRELLGNDEMRTSTHCVEPVVAVWGDITAQTRAGLPVMFQAVICTIWFAAAHELSLVR